MGEYAPLRPARTSHSHWPSGPMGDGAVLTHFRRMGVERVFGLRMRPDGGAVQIKGSARRTRRS